ncbi:triose-phosphate isomerase [Meridianimarinicoccus aquatilis]|uniref:Triosephosphate isomerase n=1 Tax=Meridianimarinicoccus aquatilis TaxID=2552766 RepID=A0A4R6AJF6_9RHOB|nr:triose-phosphate isomerase [Fluviibacterium aquatile]QIE42264.1 triose-phosphate isomerase [Rhodobacteraceae bacterium SC52]TDL84361.1 triose-phosphate isomerase [Fluviibacterium aquatile]
MRRKLAAGNWKMNGGSAELAEIRELLKSSSTAQTDILICPPATLIERMRALVADAPLSIGGQDCHVAKSGAHTGDISAGMLADAGASHVIVGHSERRQDHGETDAIVRAKATASWGAGLIAVICIGETLDEREGGKTLDVIATQLDGSVPDEMAPETTVIAYEPVWAIGTGLTPTLEQIGEVHDFIRSELGKKFAERADGVRLLYGGSVKPSNAAEIFGVSNVDGALVGGASLKASDFSGIIAALEAS